MKGFLLDTNVISETIKPKPHPKVAAWIDSVPEEMLYLSVLTLGEVRKGIEAVTNSSRRLRLTVWLDHDLVNRFIRRILPVDLEVALKWGEIDAKAAARGRAIPVIDGLLAATTVRHDLTLVTRDCGHARDAGVPVFNPWEE